MCLVVLLQRHRKALQRKGLAHSLTKKFLRNCSPVKRLKMAMVRLEMTMVALMAAQAPLVRTASSLQHFIHVKHVSWGLGSCKLSVDQLNLEWDKIDNKLNFQQRHRKVNLSQERLHKIISFVSSCPSQNKVLWLTS
ncbi:hypothetical protein SETIT_4G215200v2 [Setaria italica]|uniref:Uncharacterized protein n=1 Tax=Setaria italica TaxID=4555 RepID=A0A368QWU6_SETIT|nr:hypothetical protein SETIT_4G215200v2 [Setaria italica]